MTEAELIRLGSERKLIFQNYCNGVDVEALKDIFKRSAAEIEREILFVAKKIQEYRFRRWLDGSPHAVPPVQCASLLDVRVNSRTLRDTLGKLGPLYLSSELLIPKINVQKLDHPSMIGEAVHRASA